MEELSVEDQLRADVQANLTEYKGFFSESVWGGHGTVEHDSTLQIIGASAPVASEIPTLAHPRPIRHIWQFA